MVFRRRAYGCNVGRINGRRIVAPLTSHVSENRGNLLIVESTVRGHIARVHAIGDLDRSAHAVKHDTHCALVRTENPF